MRGQAKQRALFGAVILLLVAYGPPPVGPADGDAGSEMPDAAAAIAPPDIPWLAEGVPPIAAPMLTPCPEGWHEVEEEGPVGGGAVVTCDPYGDTPGGTEPDTCPAGWAHFPGDPACSPVGAPCPAGDFPEGVPADATVLYVLSSAAPGGDGTEASPLSTITAALNLASPGTVVAIGKGAYDEALVLPPGVSLWGACAAETRVTAWSPGLWAKGVITIPSADTQVEVTRVLLSRNHDLAIFAEGLGTSLSLSNLIVRDTQPRATDGLAGRGLTMQYGAAVDVTRARLSRSRDVGVFAYGLDTAVHLADVTVNQTEERACADTSCSDEAFGVGLLGAFGASLAATRFELPRQRHQPRRDEPAGPGTGECDRACAVNVARMQRGSPRSRRSRYGCVVTDRDPGWQSATHIGTSPVYWSWPCSSCAAQRQIVPPMALSRNREFGVFATGAGSSLTLSDVIVQDTQSRESDRAMGRGLGLQHEASAELTRVLLSHNHDIGLMAAGTGTAVTVTDFIVRDTQLQESDGKWGRGVSLQEGAAAEARRAVVSRNRELSIFAAGDDTSVTLTDVVVRDRDAQESGGSAGRGLVVQSGAAAEVSRAFLDREAGVFAYGLGTVVRVDATSLPEPAPKIGAAG